MSREDQESIDKMLKGYRETHEQNKLVKNPKGLRKNGSKNAKDNTLFEISKGLALNHDQLIEASNNYSTSQKKNGNSFKKFISRKETQEIKNLFKNFTFVFIPDKYELSQKRIEIFQNQIILNQGMIYYFFRDIVSLDNFHKNHHEKHHFIITSKNTLYEDCFKYLCQFGLDIRSKNCYFVDFEWISECLRLNKIIDPNIYRKFIQYSDGNKIKLPNINVYKQKEGSILFNIEESFILEEFNKEKPNIEENPNLDSSKSFLLNPTSQSVLDSKMICEEINNFEMDEKKSFESKSININTDAIGLNDSNANDLGEEMEIEIIEIQNNHTLHEIRKFDSFLYDYNYYENYMNEIKSEKIEYDDKKISIFAFKENDDEDEEIQIISSNKSIKMHDSLEKKTGTIFEGIECEIILPKVKEDKVLNPGQIRKEKYWDSKKNNFFCSTGIPKTNYNAFITDELDKLLKIYSNEGDKGRMIAYRKAIGILKCQQKPIESLEDIENLPSIGVKIRKKTEEILETGCLKKAQYMKENIHNKSIEELSGVWGIGPTTAEKLYFKGIKTIEELRKNQNLLNDNQKIGLKYYEELKMRIPRDEIEKVCKILKDKIEEIADTKNAYEMIPCGSYRRGKATCGDIDILITRIDGGEYHGFLHQLMKSLEKTLLTEHLSYPRNHHDLHDSESYMGIYQLENNLPHRRVDIKVYPRSEFGYAVLYFTGSDYFNRSMRLFARKKGYTLSDKGLFPAFRVRNQKVWEGQNIPCYTEEDVFKVLGLEYRKPEERDV